ncbi:MAG: rhodanese-like domain-containing protein [Pelagimonas sp.]|jgi:rhodanese-related sulfurtransferase|nr:rhodanese-like domain-containing protein [Pelagimonas sp.]
MIKGLISTLCAASFLALPAFAQQTRITADRDSFSFVVNGANVTIDRQGPACPPACLQPMQAVPGVATIAELELMDFLELFAAQGQGLLIDTRLPERFGAGTIPGAVNVPAATLGPSNPYRDDLLNALGVRGGDFGGAYDLVLFGEGPVDAQVVQAVQSLVGSGYPPSKVKYYRGGMQVWQALGLSIASGR